MFTFSAMVAHYVALPLGRTTDLQWSMLKLRLLGNATIQDDHGSLSGRAVQPRRLALLTLLALAPRRSLSREKLLAYLWPESDTEQGRHLLSVALYELRKALGEGTVVTGRDDVTLVEAALAVDVDEFDSAIRAGAFEQAVELYAGPLLDGFHINDAPDFERWLDAQREHFARRYAEALEKAAQARASRGDVQGAVEAWRKLAAHDPYAARVVCGLMLALEAADDRAGALQLARTHAAAMREEFGAEPDPEVTAIADRLKTAPREAAVQVARPHHDRAVPSVSAPRGQRRRIVVAAIAVLLALGAVFTWQTFFRQTPAAQATANVAIAVLPFENLSAADSAGYFSDGIAEEIISALSRVPTLRVVSRASSFVFRGHVDRREVGRVLNVGHVIEGAVRMGSGRIRVTAHLISTQDGYDVWSQDYEYPLEMANLLSIQQQIANSVVAQLAERFGRSMSGAPVPSQTKDIEAFEKFVTGKHFFHRRTVPDLQRAVEYYDQAIARDPRYALAHAGRAEVFALLGAYDYGALSPEVAFTTARAAADRALEIDPNLAEAHSARASVLYNYDWDWDAAEQEFRRAIGLSPGYATARHWYSLLLQSQLREREAFEQIVRAREVDPLSSVTSTALARHYYYARKRDQAIAEYQRTIDVDSGFVTAHIGLGLSYAAAGDYDRAIASYQTAARVLGMSTPLIHGLLANAYGLANRSAEATRHARVVESSARQRYVPAEYLAIAYIGLRDHDAAFKALDQAMANRSGGMTYLNVEPLVDPLRSDPRFPVLLRKVGLHTR